MNNNLKVPKIYNPSCKLMPVRNLVIMNDAYPHPCKSVIIISVIYSRYAFPTVTNSKTKRVYKSNEVFFDQTAMSKSKTDFIDHLICHYNVKKKAKATLCNFVVET